MSYIKLIRSMEIIHKWFKIVSQIKLTAAASSAAATEFVSFVKRHLQPFPRLSPFTTLSLSDFG